MEVLDSIYDGDENFKKLDAKTYQYMITHPSNEHKNFLLEIAWGDEYPDEPPDVNLNAFFNKHILPAVKTEIRESLLKEVSGSERASEREKEEEEEEEEEEEKEGEDEDGEDQYEEEDGVEEKVK